MPAPTPTPGTRDPGRGTPRVTRRRSTGAPSAATVATVARHAGVSQQTVSRVVNGAPHVSEATRSRVEAAIEALGYRPNRFARTLATRRSMLLGIVAPEVASFGPNQAANAIDQAAREHGYATTMAMPPMGADAATLREHFLGLGVDGVVVIAPEATTVEAARELASHLATCVIAAGVEVPWASVVGVDQRIGARLATRHLADTGRTRIAHLAGPESWFDAAERAIGWREELQATGLAGSLIPGDWTAATGYHAGLRLGVDEPLPDAVFAANDMLAVGLLRALAERGIRVPDDVAVVGFDAVDGSDQFQPPLSTMSQPFAEVGRRALAALLASMRGDGPSVDRVPPVLVERRSSRVASA